MVQPDALTPTNASTGCHSSTGSTSLKFELTCYLSAIAKRRVEFGRIEIFGNCGSRYETIRNSRVGGMPAAEGRCLRNRKMVTYLFKLMLETSNRARDGERFRSVSEEVDSSQLYPAVCTMPCLLLRTFLVSSSLLAYVTTGTAIPRTEAIHPFLSQLPWDIQQTPEEWIVQNAPSELELDKRNWKIPTSGLPLASTVGNWIFTNDSSWPVLANAAIRRMQTWLVRHLYFSLGEMKERRARKMRELIWALWYRYFTNTNLYDSLSWWQNPVVMLCMSSRWCTYT